MPNQVIIADAGFWIALHDPRDQYHDDAKSLAEFLPDNRIIFPWPCLYETLSTRFIRERSRVLAFEQVLTKPEILRLNDEKYRESSLRLLFNLNRQTGTTFSLTDIIIREIILDTNLRIKFMLTFNKRDFYDLETVNFKIL